MSEENSEPQKEAVANVTENTHDTDLNLDLSSNDSSSEESEKTVPLSVVLKERKKRQKAEEEREYYKKMSEQKPAQDEDDYTKYESVTREELGKSQFETYRMVREGDWAETYPERMAIVEAELEDFLKQRPNLGPAIQSAQNRYKEAWELMQALKPKNAVAKSAPNKQAPLSPGGVPKAAALNEAVDLMNMSDSEFIQWRQSQRKRR